jgi:hypothetical protein
MVLERARKSLWMRTIFASFGSQTPDAGKASLGDERPGRGGGSSPGGDHCVKTWFEISAPIEVLRRITRARVWDSTQLRKKGPR